MNSGAASEHHSYHHRRPFNRPFYDRIAADLATAESLTSAQDLPVQGLVQHVDAGSVLTIRLVRAAQVVHLFAWNPADPDERIWPHETSGIENAFLNRYSRIWGTMARFRPLLTIIEDTVQTIPPAGSHHFTLGGFEVPTLWRAAGGSSRIVTSWERFQQLLASRDLDRAIYRDHISLFQKMVVDVPTQRFLNAPSDARANDRVSLYAEAELDVALVPSPYRGGGIAPAALDGAIEPVRVEVRRSGVAPLGWPYPGVPYPDISPYIDTSGRRK
jgi:uncharacterized protein YcgI (DUF1989 family)